MPVCVCEREAEREKERGLVIGKEREQEDNIVTQHSRRKTEYSTLHYSIAQ